MEKISKKQKTEHLKRERFFGVVNQVKDIIKDSKKIKLIYRYFKGKLFFKQKESSFIYGKAYRCKKVKISHGRGLSMYGNIEKVSFIGNGKIEIGNQVFINNGCIFECRQNIKIGNYVKIGYRCLFIDTQSHSIDGLTPPHNSPIIIEDNVWIASNVTVLTGVTIGKNSVVATNSLVNKSIPPNCLYGGIPAKLLKSDIYKSDRPRE